MSAATHPEHRPPPPSTSLLQHSCLYISDPCRPPSSSNSRAGQVSSTPHQNEASHSEHQAHCPVLTPPLTLTLHHVCDCVHMSSFRQCSAHYASPPNLIQYCPSWDCLKGGFCSHYGGWTKSIHHSRNATHIIPIRSHTRKTGSRCSLWCPHQTLRWFCRKD